MGCSMQPIFSPFAQTQSWKVASHEQEVRPEQIARDHAQELQGSQRDIRYL